MASTEHFNIPVPDTEADVDDEFYRLTDVLTMVDGILWQLSQGVAGKAPVDHDHTMDQIEGLIAALEEKRDADASFSLDDLLDVDGAAPAPPGYVLVKTSTGVWAPSSPAAAIGNHQHAVSDILGLEDELLKAKDPWASMPIGVPIPVFLHLPGVALPPKDQDYRYVLLTAGLTGSGQYNQTVLRSETVSGTAPDITATAIVNLASSPFDGSAIHLINSMKTFLRPGTSNVIEAGQNLSHTHTATAASNSHNHTGTTANDSHTHSGTTSTDTHSHKAATGSDTGSFDYGRNFGNANPTTEGLNSQSDTSSDSHNHTFTTSSNTHNHTFTTSTYAHTHDLTVAANGGTENRPRNLNVQYIMRIA